MSISGEIKTKWGTAKLDKGGYYVITTRKEGSHHKRLHHLIWSEHYGKPVPKGYIIHHLNMNKTDNRIQNLQCVSTSSHSHFHSTNRNEETIIRMSKSHIGFKHSEETKRKISDYQKGKTVSNETMFKMSKHQNTTGYFRVTKRKESRCKQGFLWQYTYYEDSKQKKIARTDLRKLEDEVKSKGLKWVEL